MSPEISALEKYACPACGAQAEWNPTKQKLVCPFCGTESPYQYDRETGKVAELDLVTALRELPEKERGWQTERRSVQLPRRDGVRSGARGTELRVLRIALARQLRRDQVTNPAAGAVAVQDRSQSRAR
jgi:endogenous inhibitor of DNA gyrase (YacG/DUF329 family)